MKLAAVFVFLLVGCTATEVGNTLLPDEFTLGQGSSTMNTHTTGGYVGHNDMYAYDGEGEGESTFAALTWKLPSFDEGPSREERAAIRAESMKIDEIVAEELAVDTTMANGGTYKADWRHAAGFGGVIAFLLLGLLIKLTRSNGWH